MATQPDQQNSGFPGRGGARMLIVLSGCAGLAGIAWLGLLVAGDRDIAYLGGSAAALLVLAYHLTAWLRNRKIVLPTIPEPLSQELKTHLERGDLKTVLARLHAEYPQLPFGKRIELTKILKQAPPTTGEPRSVQADPQGGPDPV